MSRIAVLLLLSVAVTAFAAGSDGFTSRKMLSGGGAGK